MAMTEYYAKRLIQAYQRHIWNGEGYKEISEYFGYSKGVNDTIRGMFNRFVKIGASLRDVEDYIAGD